MISTIVGILISALAFFLGAKLLKGIKLESFGQAVIVAIIIALLNGTLGVVLEWITPDKTLNYVTFGFFQFILDAIIIWVAGKLMKNFKVQNFLYAIILAIIVALLTSVACSLVPS